MYILVQALEKQLPSSYFKLANGVFLWKIGAHSAEPGIAIFWLEMAKPNKLQKNKD